MKFTIQEIEFIKVHYTTHGNTYCSKKLNRSKSSTQKVATRLGLKVNRKLMIHNNPELLIKLKEHQSKILQPINEISKIQLCKETLESLYNSGKSIEEIAKIYNCSDYTISKYLTNISKRNPGEYINHRSKHQFGEKNASWKGGLKSIYDRIRGLTIYWDWNKAVKSRDNNICQHCSTTDNLEVHHIKTLKTLVLDYTDTTGIKPVDFTEEDLSSEHFYDLTNGLTLCKGCHRKHHKENGR